MFDRIKRCDRSLPNLSPYHERELTSLDKLDLDEYIQAKRGVIAVSETNKNINPWYRFIALSLEKNYKRKAVSDGKIILWRLNTIAHTNQPAHVFKYDGVTQDIRFVQDSTRDLNLLISLHTTPNQLIISSLIDFKTVSIISTHIRSMRIELNPNQSQVFLALYKDINQQRSLDMISFEIGFKKNNPIKGQLSMRDQNLCTFMKSIGKDAVLNKEIIKVV